jgi:hypothetical protein
MSKSLFYGLLWTALALSASGQDSNPGPAKPMTAEQKAALQKQIEAGEKAAQAIDALQEAFNESDGIARAKFIPQCDAVTGSNSYCECLYGKLPALFTLYADEPWLVFVATMYQRSFQGQLTEIKKDEAQQRLDLFMTARKAVQQCSTARAK